MFSALGETLRRLLQILHLEQLAAPVRIWAVHLHPSNHAYIPQPFSAAVSEAE